MNNRSHMSSSSMRPRTNVNHSMPHQQQVAPNRQIQRYPMDQHLDSTKKKKDKSSIKSLFFDKELPLTPYEKQRISRIPGNSLIYADSIIFKYKNSEKVNLNHLSLNINQGDFHGLIGNNGAGKSTLIKIICGVNTNYDGYLFIHRDNPKRVNYLRKEMSYIPDTAVFPKYISCRKFLFNSAILCRDDPINIKDEIEKWAQNMEITGVMNRNPNNLSAGQQKKILIIKAIIEKSKILVLDEPASNLDIESRNKLFEILKYLNKRQGVTVIISSHILDEIKHYLNSVSIIKQGTCRYSGPANEGSLISLYEQYK